MSSLSPTRDSPRAAELLRKARSQFTFTSEEKKTFKRAQQQHVLVDGYIEKQRRGIVADCSCADISSDHNIIFLLLILEKVLCAISLHISLHCSFVASRRRPNWFRYESYCSCWPETRNILILNVSIWPRTNERKKSANIDCGTWNLSPDLLRSLSSWSVLCTRPLQREIQFYAVALVPRPRTILPVLMATTRYIGTRSQTSFVPFARHLISISRVSVPLSPSVVVERRNKNQFDPLDQEEEGGRTRYVPRVCPEGIHTIFRNETRSPVFDVLPSIHSFILDPHLPL